MFFNLILIASPLHVAVYLVARRRLGPRFAAVRGKLVRALCVLQLALFALVTPERFASPTDPMKYIWSPSPR